MVNLLKENSFNYFIPVAQSNELKAVANVIPFQLISYYLALSLGNNIDKTKKSCKICYSKVSYLSDKNLYLYAFLLNSALYTPICKFSSRNSGVI